MDGSRSDNGRRMTAAEREVARAAASRAESERVAQERRESASKMRALLTERRRKRLSVDSPSASATQRAGTIDWERVKRETNAQAIKALVAARKKGSEGHAAAGTLASCQISHSTIRDTAPPPPPPPPPGVPSPPRPPASGGAAWARTASGWGSAVTHPTRQPTTIPVRTQQSREAGGYTSTSAVLDAIDLKGSLANPCRAVYTAGLLGELVEKGIGDGGESMTESCWRLLERPLQANTFGSARAATTLVCAVRGALRRVGAPDDTEHSGTAVLTCPPIGSRMSLTISVRMVAAAHGAEPKNRGRHGPATVLRAVVAFESRFRGIPEICVAPLPGVVDAPTVESVDRSGFIVSIPRPSLDTHSVALDWTARPSPAPHAAGAVCGQRNPVHAMIQQRVGFLNTWLAAHGGLAEWSPERDRGRAERAGEEPALVSAELMDFPTETLEHILSFFLDDATLLAFALTCARAYAIAMQGAVWHALCMRLYGSDKCSRIGGELSLGGARDPGWRKAHRALQWQADHTTEELTLWPHKGYLQWSSGSEQHGARHTSPREVVQFLQW
jgi:hypothetical protein